MEKNRILSDFIVLNRQRVDELEANLWQMEHRKSGARLVRLERAEENKGTTDLIAAGKANGAKKFKLLQKHSEVSLLCILEITSFFENSI